MIEDKIDTLIASMDRLSAAFESMKSDQPAKPAKEAKPEKTKPAKEAKPAKEEKHSKEAILTTDLSDDGIRREFAKYLGTEDSDGYLDRREWVKTLLKEHGATKIVGVPQDRRKLCLEQLAKKASGAEVNFQEDEQEEEL